MFTNAAADSREGAAADSRNPEEGAVVVDSHNHSLAEAACGSAAAHRERSVRSGS